MEDTEIIDLYWQRDERAITETDRKYGNYCFAVADNILMNREDSEECVSDTWLRAWRSIPPGRPKFLRAFLAKITRNLAFDRYRAKGAAKRGSGVMDAVLDELTEVAGGEWDAAAVYEAKQLRQAIDRFTKELPERERYLFIRRYFYAEDISKIAERYSMTQNNVTVNLSRSRKKLKKYLSERGFIQ